MIPVCRSTADLCFRSWHSVPSGAVRPFHAGVLSKPRLSYAERLISGMILRLPCFLFRMLPLGYMKHCTCVFRRLPGS